MDCNWACSMIGKCLLAVAVWTVCDITELRAKPAQGFVYNPVTQQMEPKLRTRRLATWTPADRPQPRTNAVKQAVREKPVATQFTEPEFDDLVEPASHESDEYYNTCDSQGCCDDVCTGCGDPCCGDCVGYSPGQFLYVGFEATLVKPRFESNEAFTVMNSDGALFESFNETEFDYDMEFTPRVFVGWQRSDGIGLRVTWWQFDHSATNLSANPPANGFGEVAAPPFGDVEISSNNPPTPSRPRVTSTLMPSIWRPRSKPALPVGILAWVAAFAMLPPNSATLPNSATRGTICAIRLISVIRSKASAPRYPSKPSGLGHAR